jgi:hypothetical protein
MHLEFERSCDDVDVVVVGSSFRDGDRSIQRRREEKEHSEDDNDERRRRRRGEFASRPLLHHHLVLNSLGVVVGKDTL